MARQTPSTTCAVPGPRRTPRRARPWTAAAVLAALTAAACAQGPTPIRRLETTAAHRDSVSFLAPRCAGTQSCLLGRVTSSESSAPLPGAAVFFEREDGKKSERLPPRLTDDQGIFVIADPPPGQYRMAVYKDARHVEVVGIELGGAGTTLVPVRLAAKRLP